jgi:predicted Zn-dependent peptidase
MEKMMKKFELINIDGINLVYLQTEGLTSSFGVACIAGASYEDESNAGISHFCEHMFFKGTKTRNYEELCRDIEIKGIQQNAFTSNFTVMYYMKCANAYVEDAISNILDMFQNSTFPEVELEKERDVILEEKKMSQDQHFSYMHDQFEKIVDWKLSHPILGYNETISKFSKDDLLKFLDENLNRERVCLVFSGNEEKENVIKYIRANIDFGHSYFKVGDKKEVKVDNLWIADAPAVLDIHRDNLKQSYVFQVMPSVNIYHKDYYTQKILVNAIGGAGMYNRMFMEVREKRGLAYSTGCFESSSPIDNASMFIAYGLINADKFEEYLDCVKENLEDIKLKGITQDEFDCAKSQELFRLAQASESSSGHLNNASSFIHGKMPLTSWEKLEEVSKVTIEDCNEYAKKLINFDNMKIMHMRDMGEN